MTVWTYGFGVDTSRVVNGYVAMPSAGVVEVFSAAPNAPARTGVVAATGLLEVDGTTPITGNVLQADLTRPTFPRFAVSAATPPDLWVSVDNGPVTPLAADDETRYNTLSTLTVIEVDPVTAADDVGPLLQAAIDRGLTDLSLRPTALGDGGTVASPVAMTINTPVFVDSTDTTYRLHLHLNGVRLVAGPNLPKCQQFTDWLNDPGHTRPNPNTRWAFFPNVKKTAWNQGTNIVDASLANRATVARGAVGVRLTVIEGVFDGNGYTDATVGVGNVGMVYAVGCAVHLQRVIGDHCRALRSWNGYNDLNRSDSCYLTNVGAVADAWCDYITNNGDGFVSIGGKVDGTGQHQFNGTNGAFVAGSVGGWHKAADSHALVFYAGHSEDDQTNASLAGVPVYDVDNSHGTTNQPFNFTGVAPGTAMVRVKDTAGVKHSDWTVRGALFRIFYRIDERDPAGYPHIYIDTMNLSTRVRVRDSGVGTSVQSDVAKVVSRAGLWVGGSAAEILNGLTAAVAAGRDLIATGNFDIIKRNGVIAVVPPDDGAWYTRKHVAPVLGAGTVVPNVENIAGTLTENSTQYYCAAMGNSLPDGTVEWGPISNVVSGVVGSTRALRLQFTCPSRPGTLGVWRGGSDVATNPTAQWITPWDGYDARVVDTFANVNMQPWQTGGGWNLPTAVDHTSVSTITRDGRRRWTPLTAYRTTQDTYPDQTPKDATDLALAVDAPGKYRMRLSLYYAATHTSLLAVRFNPPTGSTGRFGGVSPQQTGSATQPTTVNATSASAFSGGSSTQTLNGFGLSTIIGPVIVEASFVATQPGTITPRFSQSVSDAGNAAVVYDGSTAELTRLS